MRHSSDITSAGDSGVKARHGVPETISSEDYFKRSAEFRAWLSEKVKVMHAFTLPCMCFTVGVVLMCV